MRINWLWLLFAVVSTVLLRVPVEGGRVMLRPLSAQQVYRVLREAGREDAVPEGRIVSQGIAAMKGFALGVAKGAGGALLVNLLSNSTMFSGMFNGNGNNNGSTGGTTNQEICFSSRSVSEIEDTEPQGRQETPTPPDTGLENTGSGSGSVTGNEGTGEGIISDTPTATSTSVDGTDGGDDRNILINTASNAGDNTGTISESFTQTGGGAINCIVIQKPT